MFIIPGRNQVIIKVQKYTIYISRNRDFDIYEISVIIISTFRIIKSTNRILGRNNNRRVKVLWSHNISRSIVCGSNVIFNVVFWNRWQIPPIRRTSNIWDALKLRCNYITWIWSRLYDLKLLKNLWEPNMPELNAITFIVDTSGMSQKESHIFRQMWNKLTMLGSRLLVENL